MEPVKGKIVSQYGVEVRLIADTLAALQVGEQVTYAKLSEVSGIDVLKQRGLIGSARRQVLNDSRAVFDVVIGVGLRRMNDDEIAGYGMVTARRIGRQARRGLKVVSAGEYDRMSPAAKVNQAIGITVLNMIQHSTTRSAVGKLEATLPQNAKALPLAETLKQLAG